MNFALNIIKFVQTFVAKMDIVNLELVTVTKNMLGKLVIYFVKMIIMFMKVSVWVLKSVP